MARLTVALVAPEVLTATQGVVLLWVRSASLADDPGTSGS
jgi:hypothetical protein